MNYKVVPFVAQVQKGQNANEAAGQLQELINSLASQGWKYLRLENVEINVYDPGSKGCFGFGTVPPSQQTTRYDMAVFCKEG